MRLKSLVSTCFLLLTICAGAQTTVSIAPDAPSREDVQKLFDVMASREQMAQMMAAQRAYQANLTTIDRARDAYQAALELGK